MSQETLAILAIGLPCLGGIIHIVWKLGEIAKGLAVLERRVFDLESERK